MDQLEQWRGKYWDTFGKRLKYVIKDRGYTQDDFANKIGVANVTLRKYLNGTIDPPLSNYLLICDTLDIPYDTLLSGDLPFNLCYRSLYGMLKAEGYDIQCNPDNEDQALVIYKNQPIYFDFSDLENKVKNYIDFYLYQNMDK